MKRHSRFVQLLAVICAATLLIQPGSALGQGAMRRDSLAIELSELVRQAEFIFQGTVVDLSHRLSDVRSDKDVRLPHTFVTYKVEKRLKGKIGEEKVTLRFLGGPAATEGRFLMVEDVPFFDLGNQDILFVAGNGKLASPIVGFDAGRFRVADGKMYTNHGRELMVSNKDQLVMGELARPDLVTMLHAAPSPERSKKLQQQLNAIRDKVPAHVWEKMRAELEQRSRGSSLKLRGVESQQDRITGQTRRVSKSLEPAGFHRLIAEHVRRQKGSEPTRKPAVLSVDIKEKFFVAAPRPLPPPGADESAPLTDEERRELELFKENEGNPVIKKR